MNMRTDKTNYFLDIAAAVAKRGTCLRRNFGSVIVKNEAIVSTGYTGAPRGRINCCDRGVCLRQERNIPHGERYELCRSVHSEQNAIINAAKHDMEGATLYLVGLELDGTFVKNAAPCSLCKRLIINSGIKYIVCKVNETDYRKYDVEEFVSNDDSLTGNSQYDK